MVDDRSCQAAGRCKVQNAEGKLGENWHWEGGAPGEDGVRVGDDVVAALAGVGFGRILKRLQVVGHRDNREQDQYKHGQGDKLRMPVLDMPIGAGTRGDAQPQAEHERCQRHPGEIESQLHSQN